jgi:hypothetical protein
MKPSLEHGFVVRGIARAEEYPAPKLQWGWKIASQFQEKLAPEDPDARP